MCVADSSVYVIGGFGRHRVTLDTVDCYDTVGRTWRRCAPLAAPLYSCPACYLGGRLYVFTTQVSATPNLELSLQLNKTGAGDAGVVLHAVERFVEGAGAVLRRLAAGQHRLLARHGRRQRARLPDA